MNKPYIKNVPNGKMVGRIIESPTSYFEMEDAGVSPAPPVANTTSDIIIRVKAAVKPTIPEDPAIGPLFIITDIGNGWWKLTGVPNAQVLSFVLFYNGPTGALMDYNITEIIVDKANEVVTLYSSFNNLGALTKFSVSSPDVFPRLSAADAMDFSFVNCGKLTHLQPFKLPPSVKSMEDTFAKTALTRFPAFDTTYIESFEESFMYGKLEEIPSSISFESAVNMKNAFYGTNLKTFNHKDFPKVESFESTFQSTASLEDVSVIDAPLCKTAFNMFRFSGLKRIQELHLPVTTNFKSVFEQAKELKYVGRIISPEGEDFTNMFAWSDSLVCIDEIDTRASTAADFMFYKDSSNSKMVPYCRPTTADQAKISQTPGILWKTDRPGGDCCFESHRSKVGTKDVIACFLGTKDVSKAYMSKTLACKKEVHHIAADWKTTYRYTSEDSLMHIPVIGINHKHSVDVPPSFVRWLDRGNGVYDLQRAGGFEVSVGIDTSQVKQSELHFMNVEIVDLSEQDKLESDSDHYSMLGKAIVDKITMKSTAKTTAKTDWTEAFIGNTSRFINFKEFDWTKVNGICKDLFKDNINLRCITNIETNHSGTFETIFPNCPKLEHPTAAEVAQLEAPGGDAWTNTNSCPPKGVRIMYYSKEDLSSIPVVAEDETGTPTTNATLEHITGDKWLYEADGDIAFAGIKESKSDTGHGIYKIHILSGETLQSAKDAVAIGNDNAGITLIPHYAPLEEFVWDRSGHEYNNSKFSAAKMFTTTKTRNLSLKKFNVHNVDDMSKMFENNVFIERIDMLDTTAATKKDHIFTGSINMQHPTPTEQTNLMSASGNRYVNNEPFVDPNDTHRSVIRFWGPKSLMQEKVKAVKGVMSVGFTDIPVVWRDNGNGSYDLRVPKDEIVINAIGFHYDMNTDKHVIPATRLEILDGSTLTELGSDDALIYMITHTKVEQVIWEFNQRTVGGIWFNAAFWDCYGTKMDLTHFPMDKFTILGARQMFVNCSNLTCVTNLDTTKIPTDNEGRKKLFDGCYNVTNPTAAEIVMLESDAGLKYINKNPC